MIEITYFRKKHKVTMTGHAKSDDYGKDVVCSAASMLVYTLASNVTNLYDSNGTKKVYRRKTIKLKPGDAVVSLSPVHDASHLTTLIFDTLCCGFELLARNYPEYVKYKRI